MPALARLYVDPTATTQSKGAINIVYEILNAYMGGIGELSGVSLFAVIWLALTGISLLQKAQLPKWVAYFGFVAAASLFFNLIELLGIDPWTDDHHIRRCPPLLDVRHRSRALEQEDIKQLTTPPNAHS